jgi:membrane protease YdiL (CAAX protease family)
VKEELFLSFKFNGWFLIAWLLPLVLSVGGLGIGLLFPDVSFSLEMKGMFDRFEGSFPKEQVEEMKRSIETFPLHPIWLTLIQGLVAGPTINAVFGFGEELGWRAFLPRMLRNMHFLKASLLIGLIWGIWHSPLILMGHNYPDHPKIGVLMMTLWCILLTPLFLYISIRSRSVIAAAIFHGTINALAGIGIMLIEGGNDLLVGVTGLAGFIALSLLLLLFYLYDRSISKSPLLRSRIGDHF